MAAGLTLAACQGSTPQVARSAPGPRTAPTGVTRRGDVLLIDGKPGHLVGLNAWELATVPGLNGGCGPAEDVDAFFQGIKPGTAVRTWLFQAAAVNIRTRTFDWTAMDHVVTAAARAHIRLIAVLGDQTGLCDDGHWHDQAWYDGGYRSIFDDAGDHADLVSWWQWLHLAVERYRTSPAIAAWEPVNEPEPGTCDAGYTGKNCYGHGGCPSGYLSSLRSWFDTVGGELHRLDPRHLVSSGTIGNGECGSWTNDYATVGTSPGIDLLTVHDYDPNEEAGPMQQHLEQALALDKPILWEEVGTDGGCRGLPVAQRARLLNAKRLRLLEQPEVAGFLLWQWVSGTKEPCGLEFPVNDPANAYIRATVPR